VKKKKLHTTLYKVDPNPVQTLGKDGKLRPSFVPVKKATSENPLVEGTGNRGEHELPPKTTKRTITRIPHLPVNKKRKNSVVHRQRGARATCMPVPPRVGPVAKQTAEG